MFLESYIYVVGIFGFGVNSNQYASFIATLLGGQIFESTYESEIEDSIKNNIWLTWECFCQNLIGQGLFTIDQLMVAYTVLMRQPMQEDPFDYSISNAPEGQPMKLYDEIQGFFRPHLSTAFLPEDMQSNKWNVTGKPVKGVEARPGFGLGFPNALNAIFDKYDFRFVDKREIEIVSQIIADTFIHVLFASNDEKRRIRLAMRTAAWEFLPFYAMLLLLRRPS